MTQDNRKIVAEIKDRLESSDPGEILNRIDYLIDQEKEIQPHMVGLKMALVLVNEMKNGIPLGQESSKVVLDYKDRLTENELEEAIAYAKEFITKPEDLANKLAEKLFDGLEVEEENDED